MVYALPKRGLKPLVLYSLANEAWKVTDFGFTMEGSSRRAHTTVNSRGTPSYLAPELISEAEPRYTNKVDMWGVGCILYELVLRRKAFGNDFETLRYADSGKRYDIIIEPEILPDDRRREFISKIIKELLSIDPSQRPRADLLYKRFISWGSDISVHPPDPTNPFPSHILLPSDVAHTDSSTTIIDHSPLPVNHSIPTTATQGSEHSQLALANASDYSAVTSSDTHPAPKSADHAEIEPYNAELYLAGKNDHAAQESQSVQHLTNPEGHDRRVNIITSALQHPNGNKGQQSSVASKASVAIQRLVVGKNAPIDAAGDGDIEKVKKLLGLNVSTKTRNKNGQTALHLAAEKGRRDRVALLLGKMDRADVAAKDRWQNTALHRAAGNGHRDVVALLLGRMDPDDVATKDEWQQTALHWAAKEGHRDVVALLLGHMDGADVATKDDLGSTALDRAAMNGHKDVVALLLNSFAATSAKDVSLKTALDWAAKQRHRDVVTLLEKWERDHQDH